MSSATRARFRDMTNVDLAIAPLELNEPEDEATDIKWTDIVKSQCSFLRDVIGDDMDDIDMDKLSVYMKELNLKPCHPDQEDRDECLQRNCAILWQYYVTAKQKHERKVGDALVSNTNVPANYGDINTIALRLFDEVGQYQYKPANLSLMYNMLSVANADDAGNVPYDTTYIQRKKPDAVLKRYNGVSTAVVQANQRMQVTLSEHLGLAPYFVRLWALHTAAHEPQPNTRRRAAKPTTMYLLTEAWEGHISDFFQRYGRIDPHFWTRVQRLLLHALQGLVLLRKQGLALNDVRRQTLGYDIDLEHFLLWSKWTSYDHVAVKDTAEVKDLVATVSDPVSPQHDKFGFGIMVYELLLDAHPGGALNNVDQTTFHRKYQDPKSGVHANIQLLTQLTDIPQPMRGLAQVAYHFIVHPIHGQRWTYDEALQHLSAEMDHVHDPQTCLPPCSTQKPLRPFLDW